MAVSSLQELIQELHHAFDGDVVDVDHVKELMSSYKSNPADWKKFAKFDRYRYTRNLVDEGNGKFNLMLLCWGEGHSSAVHDHSDAHCFMKMLDGNLREIRFSWPEQNIQSSRGPVEGEVQEMEQVGTSILRENEVCYINDSMGLHRVENFSHTDPAVSLHLYCPPFDTCHMFDQRTGKKTQCKITFWSKYGEKLPTLAAPPSCVISSETKES